VPRDTESSQPVDVEEPDIPQAAAPTDPVAADRRSHILVGAACGVEGNTVDGLPVVLSDPASPKPIVLCSLQQGFRENIQHPPTVPCI
jgi:hypothetical protein